MTIIKLDTNPRFRGVPARQYVSQADRTEINKLGKGLDTTLKRCDPRLSAPMRRLIVGLTKAAMLRYRQGYQEIYPGNIAMANWSDCCIRTLQRHLASLENWELVVPLDAKKGGNDSNRYWINLDKLTRILIDTHANPHPTLVQKIRRYQELAQGRQKG